MSIYPRLCLNIEAGAFDVCHKQCNTQPGCPCGPQLWQKEKKISGNKETNMLVTMDMVIQGVGNNSCV